jgi:aspartyl-tRNA(Asn)/glutamyl-tRNA(Gln) amidotransferase subunit C
VTRKIDQTLVRHIGKLSRIELTDEQVAQFGPQLAEILTYFDKLQQLETDDVEPMVHAIERTNVLADDTPHAPLPTEAALANAPLRRGELFGVPKVIGEGSS